MSSKKKHLEYITRKGQFNMGCSLSIFSGEEINILREYGHWFTALTNGELDPISDLQKRFIQVAKGTLEANSLEEKAWFKYCGRKKLEKDNPDALKLEYRFDNEFFSREDYYKMHPNRH